jgi:transglutaminase-like putative cysteine protease
VTLQPHVVRLRPAPHCRTPILGYSLRVEPGKHFLNWQQDPFNNHLARLVFTEPASVLRVEVDLIAELRTLNPFDFFLEGPAEHYPFTYDPVLARELIPYLEAEPPGPLMTNLVQEVRTHGLRTVDTLVAVNSHLRDKIRYVIRMEPGIQACEETLERQSGSCRDSAWLLVQLLRQLGLAARFVSGYLIQLTPDEKPLEGPPGPAEDFTDLHA